MNTLSKQDFEQQLLQKCPNLYADMYGDMRQTCMTWGIECGSGWYDLIFKLSEQLEALIVKMPEEQRKECKAEQVKEKFGCLRFYISLSNPEINKLVAAAEQESSITCEECGQPGKRRSKGWIRTLCDPCQEQPNKQKTGAKQ